MDIKGINWLDNKKTRGNADVMITMVGRKSKHLSINFSCGAMATKFGNSERIAVGFDEGENYLCFAPGGSEGFKAVRLNDRSARIQISQSRLDGHREMHELCGNYILDYDPESKVSFIEIKSFK